MSERVTEKNRRMTQALRRVLGQTSLPSHLKSFEEFGRVLTAALDVINQEAESKNTREANAASLLDLAARTESYRRHNLGVQSKYGFTECPRGPKCNVPACQHLHTRG